MVQFNSLPPAQPMLRPRGAEWFKAGDKEQEIFEKVRDKQQELFEKAIDRLFDEYRKITIDPPLLLPTGITWVDRVYDEKLGGDPDGPLVPLPAKHNPMRVVPDFPLTAYRALLG